MITPKLSITNKGMPLIHLPVPKFSARWYARNKEKVKQEFMVALQEYEANSLFASQYLCNTLQWLHGDTITINVVSSMLQSYNSIVGWLVYQHGYDHIEEVLGNVYLRTPAEEKSLRKIWLQIMLAYMDKRSTACKLSPCGKFYIKPYPSYIKYQLQELTNDKTLHTGK